MEEQGQNSEETEVATQEPEVQTQQSEPAVQDDSQDRNWKAMRQRQKEMEMELKKRDEMIEKLIHSHPRQVQPAVEQVEDEEPDDDYIPKGKVKNVAKKAVQPLEKKIEELEKKLAYQEQNNLISSLKKKFPDFDDVVNVETLDLLEQKEPELAATIAEFKDPYKMGIQSYKYIKAMNLLEDLPNAKRAKEVEKKLEKNGKTVQTPQAFDKRPMAQAFKTTQVDNKKIYEEMMYYASQAGGF
jgi:uncharacterized coiled-coil protein SlyX